MVLPGNGFEEVLGNSGRKEGVRVRDDAPVEEVAGGLLEEGGMIILRYGGTVRAGGKSFRSSEVSGGICEGEEGWWVEERKTRPGRSISLDNWFFLEARHLEQELNSFFDNRNLNIGTRVSIYLGFKDELHGFERYN